jgi:hypothetical protein
MKRKSFTLFMIWLILALAGTGCIAHETSNPPSDTFGNTATSTIGDTPARVVKIFTSPG